MLLLLLPSDDSMRSKVQKFQKRKFRICKKANVLVGSVSGGSWYVRVLSVSRLNNGDKTPALNS